AQEKIRGGGSQREAGTQRESHPATTSNYECRRFPRDTQRYPPPTVGANRGDFSGPEILRQASACIDLAVCAGRSGWGDDQGPPPSHFCLAFSRAISAANRSAFALRPWKDGAVPALAAVVAYDSARFATSTAF